MSGSWNPAEFPNLIAGVDYDDTNMSKATRKYNCIAWAADNTTDKWWPDPFRIGKWPSSADRQVTMAAFIQAFQTLGYVVCQDASLEAGFEKIALYAERELDGSLTPTHAAKQLPNGNWTSKLGDFEDIEHFTLEALQSPIYGHVVGHMKRPL